MERYCTLQQYLEECKIIRWDRGIVSSLVFHGGKWSTSTAGKVRFSTQMASKHLRKLQTKESSSAYDYQYSDNGEILGYVRENYVCVQAVGYLQKGK
jgi:hypothetical protein